jgi:thiamine transport system permease protein
MPTGFPDRRPFAALLALASIALLIVGAFAGLLAEAWRGGALPAPDAYFWRILRFTLWQAVLSTVVSVLPALLVARALFRHPAFPGRAALLRLFAMPLALPAIVAVLGILAVLGRAGFLAPLLSGVTGRAWPGIYGLSGILVAHAFFNVPLAVRLLLGSLDAVPADQWRLAAQLGLPALARLRLLEWPALRAGLPGTAGLVFMLCVASFTVVLTLGGGPAATTLEVAVYQSLRFDFDPARAALLTLAQVLLTLSGVLLLRRLGADAAGEAAPSVSRRRFSAPGRLETAVNAAVVALAGLFVFAPLLAVLLAGLRADLFRLAGEPAVLRAAAASLGLAAGSAVMATAAAWSLAAGRAALAARGASGGFAERLLDSSAGLTLVVPPVVIGAGWFLLLRETGYVFAAAPVMVLAVNAATAVPFALRVIRPAYDAASLRHERLCRSLGLKGWARLQLIDWPVLRRPAGTAFAFAAALSLGDLGVIALFGSDAVQTLPYLLYARMGSYRTADAAGLALLLGLVCLLLMLAADRGARAEARP